MIIVGFGIPVATQAWATANHVTKPVTEQQQADDAYKSKYRLTRRGYRWINQGPFNR